MPAGFALATTRFRGRQAVITVLNTLLALPTVVVGLFMYTLVCRSSPLGSLGLLFTLPAIVIGQVILALPIMIALTHTAVAAIERAALRITGSQIEELRAVHAGYTGDDDESYDRYTDENRQFHYSIALISGNRELAETLGRLLDRLARFMVLRHAGQSQEVTHARIVDALQARNVEAARAALLDDIDTSSDVIMDATLEEIADSWPVG